MGVLGDRGTAERRGHGGVGLCSARISEGSGWGLLGALARRIGSRGGVRGGPIKGRAPGIAGCSGIWIPASSPGISGALLRGGEEGKGEREPLTGGVQASVRGGNGRAGRA